MTLQGGDPSEGEPIDDIEDEMASKLSLSEIVPGKIYLSGFGESTWWSVLSRRNIVSIVNLSGAECSFPGKIKYLEIQIEDYSSSDLLQFLDRINDWVTEQPGAVLIHCMAGISRSSSTCIAYCMREEKMRMVDALWHVFIQHPRAFPNPGFTKQLMTYEHQLVERGILELREGETEYPFFERIDFDAFWVRSEVWKQNEVVVPYDEAKRLLNLYDQEPADAMYFFQKENGLL